MNGNSFQKTTNDYNFRVEAESSKKENIQTLSNIQLASNYSSCNSTNVPKEIL